MKKVFLSIICFGIVATLVGCRTSHVDVIYPTQPTKVDGEEMVAYLKGDNTCYYLFGFIPFWTGNPSRPNTSDYELFEDRLSEIRNEAMLEKVAKQIKADRVVKIEHDRQVRGWNTLGIVWTKTIISQGLAVKDK